MKRWNAVRIPSPRDGGIAAALTLVPPAGAVADMRRRILSLFLARCALSACGALLTAFVAPADLSTCRSSTAPLAVPPARHEPEGNRRDLRKGNVRCS